VSKFHNWQHERIKGGSYIGKLALAGCCKTANKATEAKTVQCLQKFYVPRFKSKHLVKLDLMRNDLEVDDNLGSLLQHQSLKMLDLSKCNLQHLPIFKPELSCLELLELSDNQLDVDSLNQIIKIKTLQHLGMADCQALGSEEFRTIMEMPNLKFLNVSHCNVKTLQSFNTSQSKLQSLFIADNMLDVQAFQVLAQLPALTCLNVIKCSLEQQHLAYIFGMDKLIKLHIGTDKLQAWQRRKGGVSLQHILLDSYVLGVDSVYTWLPNLKLLSLDSKSIPDKKNCAQQKQLNTITCAHQAQRTTFYDALGKFETQEAKEQKLHNKKTTESTERATLFMDRWAYTLSKEFELGGQ